MVNKNKQTLPLGCSQSGREVVNHINFVISTIMKENHKVIEEHREGIWTTQQDRGWFPQGSYD